MVNQDDHDTLQRILQCEAIPEAVIAEYEVRQRMFHRAGATGALPLAALIDMVRHLGLAPLKEKIAVTGPEFDWRSVAVGTRVEVSLFGSWIAGVFLGFVESGTLAVKLDSERYVKEFRKHVVRLAGPDVGPPPPDPDEVPASLPDTEVYVGDENDAAQINTAPAADAAILDDDEPYNWSEIEPGAPVFVDENDVILDGQLLAISKVGEGYVLTVLVDGEDEPRIVPTDFVKYAGS